MARPLRVELVDEGRICEMTLQQAPGNILDQPLMTALEEALRALPSGGALRALCLRAAGENFSYGASVEEHRADEIAAALERLDRVLQLLVGAPVPTVACVQGLCLGGGLELVLACDMILATDDAQFALPEIQLGVFPPAAAALLSLRLPHNEAARMMLVGERLGAERARELGLVQEILPLAKRDEAARAWLRERFAELREPGLHYAVAAGRRAVERRLREEWPVHRQQYLDGLMTEPGAEAGIEAFLERKRRS